VITRVAFRLTGAALLLGSTCGLSARTEGVSAAGQDSGLRIVTIAGEDSVNIIQQRTAVAPIVEVRDRNDNPVAGALVTFSIQGGQNATFGGGLQSLTIATNAAGRAAAVGLSPTASGAVQINVAAAFQGQTAAATITQTNVMTAAQAAAAGGSGAGGSSGAGAGGGGGGFPTGLATAAGAGAAGLAVVATKTELFGDKNTAPELCQSAIFPGAALVGITVNRFDIQGCDNDNDPLTYRWDFGDGATSTLQSPTHLYTAVGTFTATVIISDGNVDAPPYTFSIRVSSMTGRWRVDGTGDFFDITQTGNRVAGTYTAPAQGGGTATFSGSLSDPFTTSPCMSLALVGAAAGTLTAALGGSLDRFNVIIAGGGYPPPFVSTTLTRQ
jgi:hypothetical protein